MVGGWGCRASGVGAAATATRDSLSSELEGPEWGDSHRRISLIHVKWGGISIRCGGAALRRRCGEGELSSSCRGDVGGGLCDGSLCHPKLLRLRLGSSAGNMLRCGRDGGLRQLGLRGQCSWHLGGHVGGDCLRLRCHPGKVPRPLR